MSTITLNNSDLSILLTKTLKNKKEKGIFFTPFSIINKLLIILKKFKFKSVLEPSCGTGHFIEKIQSNYKVDITGIELEKDIFDKIEHLKNKDTKLINANFLKYQFTKKYDLIVGNPPFFTIKKKDVVNKEDCKYFEGRPNIFILFIIKSLTLLNKDGLIAFVLPSSFLNCIYFNKLRTEIYHNYKIINIIDCSDDEFLDTKQNTILFIIQNSKDNKNNSDFIIKSITKNNYYIYNTKENIVKINKLLDSTKTLNELQFDVKVGSVVWNQCKDILSNDEKKTRLVYSTDIKNNKLSLTKYKNMDKKNYIDKKGLIDKQIVLNRGYGKNKYKLQYCFIDINNEYLVENHLICIKYKQDYKKEIYDKIMKSFENPKTKQFIELYAGNNALNTTEIKYILPIY